MMPVLVLLAALSMLPNAAFAVVPDAPTGAQRDVVFSGYSPLSRSTELVRRLLSPLNARRVFEISQRAGHALREQRLDVAKEKFAVYVPMKPPPRGYALLVFVPPWNGAPLPLTWKTSLDHHGMIYVSAANSGNDTDVLNRRVPLALLAAWNIMRRYPIDPKRIYIGGFSGGSRVAEQVALGYPDLFTGALLIAGSDPISDGRLALPAAALFRQFQERTRLVYLTGGEDASNLASDAHSRRSMNDLCVFDVTKAAEPRLGHELPAAPPFARALDQLDKPVDVDVDKLARCRADIEKIMDTQLRDVRNLLIAGKSTTAQAELEKIDARYAGLAGSQIDALAERIASGDASP